MKDGSISLRSSSWEAGFRRASFSQRFLTSSHKNSEQALWPVIMPAGVLSLVIVDLFKDLLLGLAGRRPALA